MNGFSFVLTILALWVASRALPGLIQKKESRRYHEEEVERTRRVLERDPTNAGTRAKLAGFLIDDGELDAGIHEYRTAISQMPQGPFTAEWKRRLRDALETQAVLARGERVPGFNDWRICERCQGKMVANARTCPHCNNVIQMSFWEWVLQPGTRQGVARETVPIALVLWIVAVIFMNLPNDWKATLIISSILVSGWVILRSMDK